MKTSKSAGLYLYGIVRAADAVELGPIGLEVDGSPGVVTPIVIDDIAVMASPFPARGKVLPMRKNLDAQSRVLRQLMTAPGGLLPLRFGHVVPNEREIRKTLSSRLPQLVQELSHLAGKVEMALKVMWDGDNVFDLLVSQDAALSAMRDQLFAGGREPSRDEQMEIGRVFAARLDDTRRGHVERVIAALEEHVLDVREDPVQDVKAVMNLSILVSRAALPALEKRVDEIAEMLPDALLVKYTGPFAPFHFVDLDLDDDADDAAEDPAVQEAS
jgi:hypothetical protein